MTAHEREELAAAVERLKCEDEFSPTWKCGYNSALAAAAALIRSSGSDDGDEPVTVEWLKCLSRNGGDMSFLRLRLCDYGFHLMSPCNAVHEGIDGLRDYVAPRPATRGDIRDLCRALGVELRESSAGSVEGAGNSTGAGGSEQ